MVANVKTDVSNGSGCLPKRYQVSNMNTICVTLQTNNKIEQRTVFLQILARPYHQRRNPRRKCMIFFFDPTCVSKTLQAINGTASSMAPTADLALRRGFRRTLDFSLLCRALQCRLIDITRWAQHGEARGKSHRSHKRRQT